MWRTTRRVSRAFLLLAIAGAAAVFSFAASAQEDRTVPRANYVAAFRPYYAGEFDAALAAFDDAAATGIRSTEGRWIDSICYHAMIGECYYQMGMNGRALEEYNAAARLFLAHRDWMLRVDFPSEIPAATHQDKARVSWGVKRRKVAVGAFPERMLTFQGRLDNENAFRTGGVVAPPEYLPIRAEEVARCTMLALRRRRELLGPVAPHDPLSGELVSALGRRPAPANHWSQKWISAQLGMAYAGAGKRAEAAAELKSSLSVGGTLDHPLTSLALLELGDLTLQEEKFETAINYFLEASIVAAEFGQYDVMEEALRSGTSVWLASGGKGAWPPLAAAAAWADRYATPWLEASLNLLLAENAAAEGHTQPAARYLAAAQREMSRSVMMDSAIGTRMQFTAARVNYQSGKTAPGGTALAIALNKNRTASLRLAQIDLADKLAVGGTLSPRVAEELYAAVLREPTAADWTFDPLETLTVVTSPRLDALENYFELLLSDDRKLEEALGVAERIRRRRFLGSLPLGGRLLALRWLIGAPKSALSDKAILQRQDLLLAYPRLAELVRQSEAARGELAALPLVPAEKEKQQQQKKLLAALAAISSEQEAILADVALARRPVEVSFPPLLSAAEVREQLGPRQIILSYLATARGVYGFSVTADKVETWRVGDPKRLREQLVALLKAMGHYDRNKVLHADELENAAWKQHAGALVPLLAGGAKDDLWTAHEEIIIVPDGPLWYLPFEALPVGEERESASLIARLRVRYAPTLSTAVPGDRKARPLERTAVVTGRLHPRDAAEISVEAGERLGEALPGADTLPDRLPADSPVFAVICDRLVVYDEIDDRSAGPFDFSPLPADRTPAAGALGMWFPLPWGGPEQIVLPGFHTAAETALRHGEAGHEVFLAICGLMAGGARTILISRWRPAGQTGFDLVREFAQELPHVSASAAWRRSVRLSWRSELIPALEPRVELAGLDRPLPAEHPFFWSGYLLVDTGRSPE